MQPRPIPKPVGPIPVLSPTAPYAFGSVQVGYSATLTVTIFNNGDTTATVDVSITGTAYVLSAATLSIPAGSSVQLTITFTPTAAATYNETLTLSGDITQSDAVTGTGVVAPTYWVDTSTRAFAEGLVGTAPLSAAFIFRCFGYTAGDTFAFQGFNTGLNWAHVAADDSAVIDQSGVLTFKIGLEYTPNQAGPFSDVMVLKDKNGTLWDVPLTGSGVLLLPINNLANTEQVMLIGFGQGVQEALPFELNNDEDGTFTLTGSLWGFIAGEKDIMRVALLYEDLGIATITVTADVVHDNTVDTVSTTLTIGTAGATGKTLLAFADLITSGYLVELTISRAAAGGAVSLVSVVPYIVPRGEPIEGQ